MCVERVCDVRFGRVGCRCRRRGVGLLIFFEISCVVVRVDFSWRSSFVLAMVCFVYGYRMLCESFGSLV